MIINYRGGIVMTFGQKLRELRESRGIQQGELAGLLGVSRWTIANYEKGGTHPQDRSIYKKLAGIFRVDINYFLTENEEFLANMARLYGEKGRSKAELLLAHTGALLAGDELSDEELQAFKDEMMGIFVDSMERSGGDGDAP
jgi:transcriptional regulator with XRE-family HTH domain